SPTVCNIWKNGHVEHGPGKYAAWTEALAIKQGVPSVDLTSMLAERYDAMGPARVDQFFSGSDTAHTNYRGAEFVASVVAAGLRSLKGDPLGGFMLVEPKQANECKGGSDSRP